VIKKRKAQLPKNRSQPPTSAYSPSGQLREVLRRLRRGELAVAIRMGNDALEAVQRNGHATGVEAARQLLAEAHFRAAAGTTEVVSRLDHLDKALGHAPGLGKLHFYRGLALWQLGRLPEAIPELDAAFAAEPQRPRLAYLRQLVRLASGQPWDADKLPAAEANTLHVVAKLLQEKATEPVLAALPGPTLGKGSALWQALLEMRRDASAAPVELLHQATTENTRRPVQAVLLYYLGVAAARAGATGEASSAWVKARSLGLGTPWLRQNQVVFLQGQATEDALTGRWQEFLDAAHQVPLPPGEPLLAELVGIAHYHAGYAAAQAGRWHVAVEHWRQAQELHGSRNVAQNLALAEEKLGHWKLAADAWREMIRRRPRKPEHADYLSDAQVAVIWDHVAECYERAGVTGEALVTLKNAAKYAPESVDRRLKLVDALVGEERDVAAINELRRILELEPQHEDALMRLGALYKQSWRQDPMPIWRRVLAANPASTEAREELAEAYLAQVTPDFGEPQPLMFYGPHTPREKISLLERALKEVPGHPKLLYQMGFELMETGKKKEALPLLILAYDASPTDAGVVGNVLHELLHAQASDEVIKRLPQVRQIPGLLPAFWIHQAKTVLECKLGRDWAERFFNEALQLVGRPWVDDTWAGIMLQIVETADASSAKDLAAIYAERVIAEAPASGASEYLEARRIFEHKHDAKAALKLLRKAQQVARAAKDQGVLLMAEAIEAQLSGRRLPKELLDMLKDLR
jgi:tetratricopeptide (TPR) repeat protein